MPIPLESFMNSAATSRRTQPNLVDTDFNSFSKDAFKRYIVPIQNNQIEDHDLCIIIKNNLESICKDIIDDDKTYVPLLTNPKFVSCFIRAVNSVPVDYTLQLACNKITYDYFTSENPDKDIKREYLNLSKIVNKPIINKLISIGLDENTASNLALCRYSSTLEKTNVLRLNFAIYYRDPNVMTEQTVVWIYEKLFNRISDLFQATMFEVYNEQQQIEFGENFMENYGTVGLVNLIILNIIKVRYFVN